MEEYHPISTQPVCFFNPKGSSTVAIIACGEILGSLTFVKGLALSQEAQNEESLQRAFASRISGVVILTLTNAILGGRVLFLAQNILYKRNVRNLSMQLLQGLMVFDVLLGATLWLGVGVIVEDPAIQKDLMVAGIVLMVIGFLEFCYGQQSFRCKEPNILVEQAETIVEMEPLLDSDKIEIAKRQAEELFSLSILKADEYLVIKKGAVNQEVVRFFEIISRLPVELQMVMANHVYGLPREIIKKDETEKALKRVLKGFYQES